MCSCLDMTGPTSQPVRGLARAAERGRRVEAREAEAKEGERRDSGALEDSGRMLSQERGEKCSLGVGLGAQHCGTAD